MPAPDAPHPPPPSSRFVARWDLDKTYLRTEFDSLRDLVRTAFERPDQKRTVPGAASLLRELGEAGAEVHILSGSPRQMRGRLEAKLRLDGARYASLTLKPNLENALRLRLRALRDQLGFKLPALLRSRAAIARGLARPDQLPEVLLGDDAEADAFVYSLYADVCAGLVDVPTLADVMRRGRSYEDVIEEATGLAAVLPRGPFVERILIHLDRQSPPHRFAVYGPRVVPFFNYLQAAFVLCDDGRLPPIGAARVAAEFVVDHRFDDDGLARSYADLRRRGLLNNDLVAPLREAAHALRHEPRAAAATVVLGMCDRLEAMLPDLASAAPRPPLARHPDYLALVTAHNPRHRGR